MSLYFTTVFKSICQKSGKTISIPLTKANRIIEESDISRKYISKHQLMQYYGHILQESYMTPGARIIEYTSSKSDKIASYESANLAVV